MNANRLLMISAAVAIFSAGCEVHEHERDRDRGGVVVGSSDAVADEPQGEVVSGPGVEAIDVEPDPAQRVYVYDEGYPPGTYVYDNYYYYGGYRYPRDVFVNHYVQDNIRQHRFANKDDNRRQGAQIEQRNRTEFAQTHGVRNNAGRAVDHSAQNPAPQQTNPRPNVDQSQNRAPAVEEHRPNVEPRVNQPPANNEHPANVQPSAVKPPANEEHPARVERPDAKTPANDEHRANEVRPENRPNPANDKGNAEEPKREEAK